jgi:hypothetical protein
MKTRLLLLFILLANIGFAQINGVKTRKIITDTIKARTDTIVFDSIVKFDDDVNVKDTL